MSTELKILVIQFFKFQNLGRSLLCIHFLIMVVFIPEILSAQNLDKPGSETRTVSFETNEGTALGFDLSPDGKTIVFDLLGQLWTFPAEGGEATPITDSVGDISEDLDPSFSPNGEWIVFTGNREGKSGIWLIPSLGGEPRLIKEIGWAPPVWQNARPSWSSDGKYIAFSDADRFYLHDVSRDTTVHVKLKHQIKGPLQPAWLPDGRIVTRIPEIQWFQNPEGPLRIIDPETGESEELDTSGLATASPIPSPSGKRIAYLAGDEENRLQVWVQSISGENQIQLTNDDEISPTRIRWIGNDEEILYSARGKLWSVCVDQGDIREISFKANVKFERDNPNLPPVRFPEPGSEIPARGHTGMALSPDGKKAGIIALGKLWLWYFGEDPQVVKEMPISAGWLDWSPGGKKLAWSAGLDGSEDLYITDVQYGKTRQLTSLPGQAYRPAWSPDGNHIAFFYWPAPAFIGSTDSEHIEGYFAVVPADEEIVDDRSDVLLLREISDRGRWLWSPGPMIQEKPVWNQSSDALLYHRARSEDWRTRWWDSPDGEWIMLPLNGKPQPVRGLEGTPTFLQWAEDSHLYYIQSNQLWRAEMQDGSPGKPVRLTEDAALYPSVSNNGTVLYIGEDGYRIRYPDGRTDKLGWPLTYRTPELQPMLIRDANILSEPNASTQHLSDIRIENGRIAEIAPGGTINPDRNTVIVEANGRTLIPGLIDLHAHGSDYFDYLGSFYHGVTTVREAGAAIAKTASYRDITEAGILPGPRVIIGGPQHNPGDQNPSSGSSVQNLADSGDIQRALSISQAFGATYAKMRGPRDWAAGAEFTREAHKRGLRVSGHCAYPLPLIATGIDHREHLNDCRYLQNDYQDILQLMHAADITIVTTVSDLSVWTGRAAARSVESLLEGDETEPFITPSLQWFGSHYPPNADRESAREPIDGLAVLIESGISIAAGTDSWLLPPDAIHIELEELVISGLSPAEAITAATSKAAELIGADNEIGSVEEGKIADLILLDADPLEDIRNTRAIYKVIKGGEIVDREGILEWANQKANFKNQ